MAETSIYLYCDFPAFLIHRRYSIHDLVCMCVYSIYRISNPFIHFFDILSFTAVMPPRPTPTVGGTNPQPDRFDYNYEYDYAMLDNNANDLPQVRVSTNSLGSYSVFLYYDSILTLPLSIPLRRLKHVVLPKIKSRAFLKTNLRRYSHVS